MRDFSTSLAVEMQGNLIEQGKKRSPYQRREHCERENDSIEKEKMRSWVAFST